MGHRLIPAKPDHSGFDLLAVREEVIFSTAECGFSNVYIEILK
jgi:hypothetical protein